MLTDSARAKIHQTVLNHLTAGESPDDLFNKLRTKISETEAREILKEAVFQHESAMQSKSNIDHEETQKYILEEIVRGASSASLVERLKVNVGDDVAKKIVSDAVEKYEEIKKGGHLEQLEYEIFLTSKNKPSTWQLFKRQLSICEWANVALFAGLFYLMYFFVAPIGPGLLSKESAFLGGSVMILGSLAYGSAKMRRLGEVRSTLPRGLVELAFLSLICVLVLAQNDLLASIANYPWSNVVIPLWAIIAYLIVAPNPFKGESS